MALFAAPAVRADVGMPGWSVGDYWVYSSAGSTFAGGTSGTTGIFRYDILGPDSVTVAGVSYATYHAKLAMNLTTGSVTVNYPGDLWFRTSDLAIVKVSASYVVFSTTITVTITFNPPQGNQWPLTAGKTWNSATEVTTVISVPAQTYTATDTGSLSVQTNQQITVGAGAFDTTPVRNTHASGSYDLSYWSSQAGNSARDESYDSPSASQPSSSMQLSSYRYAGGLGALLWIVIILVIVIVAIVAIGLMMRSRGRRTGAVMPQPMPPGQAWGQAPQGWQPQQPQQPQPQQPWQPPPQGR